MIEKNKGKIMIWDIETAGVQGLCADRGFVVCFGWKFVGEKTEHCITLLDYPGKNCHDDSKLLAQALNILESADSLVAHYGQKFDLPYIEARLLKAKLKPIPNTRLVDTCLIARYKLKLSSNRLGNLADFLGVETKKMVKRSGWPDWWLGALRGDKESIKKMAVYCKQDVKCLEECYLAMRHIIPRKYIFNYSIGEKVWTCSACGGHRKQDRGHYVSDLKIWKRYQCQGCGRWDKSSKAIDVVPKC